MIWDALESEGEQVADTSVGGIEAGIRQLMPRGPFGTTVYTLPTGAELLVCAAEEPLRVKRIWRSKYSMCGLRVRDLNVTP